MATDVARLSFDRARAYRGVVPQLGRVSLEAETNEHRVIDTEAARLETIDVIGPVGTPDDGYAVSQGNGFELVVGAGTMYVGGWRLEQPGPVGDYDQSDWLDRPRDWAETGREHVVLLVAESDVTAVEDPALYEVALGGPDGSARTRLLQRILRLPTRAGTCADAVAGDARRWQRDGLDYDAATAELRSNSRLQVTWEEDPTPPSVCEPTATGGYLGAENQLVRVQLTALNRDGTVDLLWGYDDASHLYRVTADPSANPVLTLERRPVDDFHRPRAGQAVQALRATAELASTDGVVEGYVAALGGVVGVLAAPYDPDLKTVQFPGPLPADYLDGDENPQLYLRVWEEHLTGVELGDPVALTGTGMQVTITAAARGPVHVDDFWCIGVRPSTPTAVYPARYLRAPQPPDGPRQWACPLAVVSWEGRTFDVLDDCRRPFHPLTELERGGGGCCTIEVHPSDADDGTLQERIDLATADRNIKERGDRVTVCFAAGRYELREPLVLRRRHSNLILSGCGNGAVLAVRDGAEERFGHGMLIVVDADDVTVRGLEFELPQVPAGAARVSGTPGGVFDRAGVRAVNAERAGLWVSIGVRVIQCAVLTVAECLFRFTVGERRMTRDDAATMPRNVFGVGILHAGGAWGLRVSANRFLHDPVSPTADRDTFHLLTGYLLAPTALSATGTTTATHSLGAVRLPAILDDALFDGNRFSGLTAAAVVLGQLGDVRVHDNVVRESFSGIALLDVDALIGDDAIRDAAGGIAAPGLLQLMTVSFSPELRRLLSLAMVFPLPPLLAERPSGAVEPEPTSGRTLRTSATALSRARVALLRRRAAEDVTADPSADGEEIDPRAFAAAAASPTIATVWDRLVALNSLGEPDRDRPVAIGVHRNTIDCREPRGDRAGSALLVFTPIQEDGADMVSVASNRFTSADARLVVAIAGADLATVNANLIAGGKQSGGLAVLGTLRAAVTGNLVKGFVALPIARPLPAPLNAWHPFNDIGS